VMDSSLMMRFTPLIETTPEPVPEVILTYDTSCLPPAIPTPEPTLVPPVEEPPDILIQIPPLEGEFTMLENGVTEQQSSPIFLDVDTTVDDANLSQCTDAPNDCSLRGAIAIASSNPTLPYVIVIPNDTYRLQTRLNVSGRAIAYQIFMNRQFSLNTCYPSALAGV